ncbi:hypothetical protein D4R86_05065 [bacterium]|nr:MAG: hypothetical protein D4R86_05065 [bacterium]
MRDRNNSKSYSAVCDECGRPCELPFKPSFGKPVYCSDCFKKKQGEGSGRSNFRSDSRSNFRSGGRSNFRNDNRSSFKERRMYSAVCDSCGERCEVPFQPTSGKPIYCDSCFNKNGGNKRSTEGIRDKGRDQLGEQMATLNLKLDKIMRVLEIIGESKVSTNKTMKDKQEKATPKEEKKIVKKAPTKKWQKKAIKKTIKKKATKKHSKKK